MKRRRVLFVLVLAVASGILAGYSVISYLQARPTALVSAEPRNNTQPVVIAAREVPLGHVLTEEDLQVIQWPAGTVPQGFATSVEEVVGRGALDQISTNEPVLAAKLADSGLGGGLPVLIPQGMRALSVRVNDIIGVAGFVIPGTRVDVILTMVPTGQREQMSKVIMQNIQAVASGQEIRANEEGEPMLVNVVTVLVTLEQAEKLILADAEGSIQMALRNKLDLESVETPGQRASRLFASSGGVARPGIRSGIAAPAQRENIIEMYKGGVRTLISY
jgi:pilus assembly protein CpaB